LLLLLRLF